VTESAATTIEAESLAALIREQSAAEAAVILDEGRERAARIRAAGSTQVDSLEASARQEGDARGRRAAAQLLAEAQAESQRRYLLARERLIDESIARARERLGAFPTLAGAAVLLERLIAEGLRLLPEGPIRVLLPASYDGLLDAATLVRLGGGRLHVQAQLDFPAGGGVILETDDGRLRFDNSFDGRIRRRRDRIRLAVAVARQIDDPTALTGVGERP